MKTFRILACIIVMLAFAGLNQVTGQWAANGVHIYNTNTGNVGIGTSTPAKLLDAVKNITEPTIRIYNNGGIGGATFQMTDLVSGADWKFKATNAGGFKIRDNANGLDVITIEPNSEANSLYIDSDGDMGIGATPITGARLYVTQTGMYGIYSANAGSDAYAIYGNSSAQTGTNYGVRGSQSSVDGAAGYFTANNSSGACAGVYGRAIGNVYPESCGVVGHHYYSGIGVGAWSYGGNLFQGFSGDYPGGTLRFYVNNAGAVYADGGYNTFKKVQMPGKGEEYRTFKVLQATENWMEDMGSSTLINGEAIVPVDPVFAQAVSLQDAYLVFLTPVSEEMVFLVVSDKSQGQFKVKGVNADGRPAYCSFDYRIVAKDSANPTARMDVVHIPAPIDIPREK